MFYSFVVELDFQTKKTRKTKLIFHPREIMEILTEVEKCLTIYDTHLLRDWKAEFNILKYCWNPFSILDILLILSIQIHSSEKLILWTD